MLFRLGPKPILDLKPPPDGMTPKRQRNMLDLLRESRQVGHQARSVFYSSCSCRRRGRPDYGVKHHCGEKTRENTPGCPWLAPRVSRSVRGLGSSLDRPARLAPFYPSANTGLPEWTHQPRNAVTSTRSPSRTAPSKGLSSLTSGDRPATICTFPPMESPSSTAWR
jgi:hypothetical protein